MNKGFTLAELMGVIVIISILAVIIGFTADRAITKSRTKTCEAQNTNIIEGTKAYIIDNPMTDATLVISLKTLQDEGYIKTDLKNPYTNKEYSQDDKVTITKDQEGYHYETNIKCQ